MAVVVTIAKSPSYNKRPLCIIYTYVCKFVVLYIHYIDICMYECVCVCKYIDMCAVYIIKHTFIFKLPIISIKSTFVRHITALLYAIYSDYSIKSTFVLYSTVIYCVKCSKLLCKVL